MLRGYHGRRGRIVNRIAPHEEKPSAPKPTLRGASRGETAPPRTGAQTPSATTGRGGAGRDAHEGERPPPPPGAQIQSATAPRPAAGRDAQCGETPDRSTGAQIPSATVARLAAGRAVPRGERPRARSLLGCDRLSQPEHSAVGDRESLIHKTGDAIRQELLDVVRFVWIEQEQPHRNGSEGVDDGRACGR